METNIKELEKIMAESVAKEVLRIQESDNPYMNIDFCKQANDDQPCQNLVYWNDDTEYPTCQLNLVSIFLVRKMNCNPNKSSRPKFRIP